MKVSLLQFLLLSVFLLGNMDAKAQLNNNLTADELRIKQEVKPFLDSLIIENRRLPIKIFPCSAWKLFFRQNHLPVSVRMRVNLQPLRLIIPKARDL